MKRIFVVLLLFTLAWSTLSGAKPRDDGIGAWMEGEVLVRYREGIALEAGEPRRKALGLERVRTLRTTTRRGMREVQLLRSASHSTEALIEALRNDPNVEVVEPNYRYRRQVVPDDPRYPELWGLARIGAPDAWDTTTGDASVVVAVLDTGVDYTHADLAANMWHSPGTGACVGLTAEETTWVANGTHGYDFAADDDGNDDADPMDNDGHGTHVAGTIAAVGNNGTGVVGVNWTTRLLAVKLERPDGFFYSADQVQALAYLHMLKEKCNINIVAANASYGGEGNGSALVSDGIESLGDIDIIFVAAAGNNSSNNDILPFTPANHNLLNIVSVAATTDADALSGFSNYGLREVDLAAPGSAILSTDLPSAGTGIVTQGATDFAATVFTFAPGIDPGITATLHHCGLAQQASDCPAGVAGNIALIERGINTFANKVQNAEAAGAAAVIIYNSVEGGENPINGTLGSAGAWLPTLGVIRSVGIALRDLGTPMVTMRTVGGYSLKNGTSMATPHVTGALALLAAQYPADGFERRIERLLAAVEPIPALAETTRTGGLLDLRRVFVDPENNPPIRPGVLAATPTVPGSVLLTWTDQSPYTTGFSIERSIGAGAFIEVATTAAGVTHYTDSGLDVSQVNRWRVRALAPGGPSAPSNTAIMNPPLLSGTVLNGNVELGEWHVYTMVADSGRRHVRAQIDQLTADGDLYVREDFRPTESSYDCRPFLADTNDETCSLGNIGDNIWFIAVNGFEATHYRLSVWLTPYPANGVTAAAVSGRRIQVEWNDNSADETEFRIDRSVGGQTNFQTLTTVGPDITVYVDEGLDEGVEYYYRVTALNPAGPSFGSAAAVATATDAATEPPLAPTGLTVMAPAPNTLALSWTDASDNEASFRIERRSGAGAFSEVAELDADTVSYTDTGVAAGTHFYRVRASNSVGSAISAEVSAVAYDAVEARDEQGVTQASFMVGAGANLSFTIAGGSGDFTVTALPNQQSGAVATLVPDGAGWRFTAPGTGAFAGTYTLVIDDDITGWSVDVDVVVPLTVVLGLDVLRGGVDEFGVTVTGAQPGVTPTYTFLHNGIGASGTVVLTGASVADGPAGNPAQATLLPANIGDAQLVIRATAGPLTGDSAPAQLFRSRNHTGWVEDRVGTRITGALVRSPQYPGPAARSWEALSDGTGAYALALPSSPEPGAEITATAAGFAPATKAVGSCISSCVLVLDIADHYLRGVLSPMFPGEVAQLTLRTSSFPQTVYLALDLLADGSGSAPFELPLDLRFDYTSMDVTAFGYLWLEDDNDGAGWNPPGADINGVVLDMVPTSPDVGVQAASAGAPTTATIAAPVRPVQRTTRVWFEYGAPGNLTQTTSETVISATTDQVNVSRTLTGLTCATSYAFRTIAENDWGVRDVGLQVNFQTGACSQPPPTGGGGGGGRVGPLMLLVLVWLGMIAVRRRANHASV